MFSWIFSFLNKIQYLLLDILIFSALLVWGIYMGTYVYSASNYRSSKFYVFNGNLLLKMSQGAHLGWHICMVWYSYTLGTSKHLLCNTKQKVYCFCDKQTATKTFPTTFSITYIYLCKNTVSQVWKALSSLKQLFIVGVSL